MKTGFILRVCAFTVLISFKTAYSKQCYACSGQLCNDNANLEKWQQITCPDDKSCLKYSLGSGDYSRTCGGACETVTGGFGEYECYTCSDNLCNGAYTRQSMARTLFTTLLLSLSASALLYS